MQGNRIKSFLKIIQKPEQNGDCPKRVFETGLSLFCGTCNINASFLRISHF